MTQRVGYTDDPAAQNDEYISLSPRQREVLMLVNDGHTDLEIAAALGIAPRTVRMHSDALRAKFRVNRRRQLRLAYENAVANCRII